MIEKLPEEVMAGYRHVEEMCHRADGHIGIAPWWHGWALRESFVAGAKWQMGRESERLTPAEEAFTRKDLLAYVATLEPEAQRAFAETENGHRDAADTGSEEYQILAEILDVFDRRAREWKEAHQ